MKQEQLENFNQELRDLLKKYNTTLAIEQKIVIKDVEQVAPAKPAKDSKVSKEEKEA